MKQRYQRSRQAGAKLPEGVLYVGRPSIWGNPWTGPDAVTAYRMFCEQVVSGVLCIGTFEPALNVKREFEKPIDEWKTLRDLMFQYRREPSDVACWCSTDKGCHGDLILALPALFHWNRAGSCK